MLVCDFGQGIAALPSVEKLHLALQKPRIVPAVAVICLGLFVGLLRQLLLAILAQQAMGLIAAGKLTLDEAFVHQCGQGLEGGAGDLLGGFPHKATPENTESRRKSARSPSDIRLQEWSKAAVRLKCLSGVPGLDVARK